MQGRVKTVKNILYVTVIFIFIAYLFMYPGEVKDSVRDSLNVGVDILIPALFPFLIISGIISSTYCGKIISYPLRFISKFIYGMPMQVAPALLSAYIGGYPSGINSLIELRNIGAIDDECCNMCSKYLIYSSPPFVITVIGASIFHSLRIGVLIFLAHIFSSILIRWISFPHIIKNRCNKIENFSYENMGDAIVNSCINSAKIIINMQAFVIISSVFLLVIKKIGLINLLSELFYGISFGIIDNGLINSMLVGCTEICSGVDLVSRLSYAQVALIAPFQIAFGGICVILQLKSLCRQNNVNSSGLLKTRLLNAIATDIFSAPIIYAYYKANATFVSSATPLFAENRAFMSICSLFGVVIMLICVLKSLGQGIRNSYSKEKLMIGEREL